MHYHYFTLEQRQSLQQLMQAKLGETPHLKTALERLRSPDYGICVDCGKDIAFVRLQADPAALHCQDCARLPLNPAP
jgi:DnaK suppressor protein